MSNIPLIGAIPAVPGDLYGEANEVQTLSTQSQAVFRGSPKKTKARRPPVQVSTNGAWTIANTATVVTSARSNQYPIPSQPKVTPLLLSGTSSGAGQYVRATQTLSPGITSRKIAISVPVFIPDYTKIASITISVSYDGFTSTSWAVVYTPEFSGNHVIGLTSRIVQGLAAGLQWTTGNGATTETPFTSVRYQVTLATSVTGSVSFGEPVINTADQAQLMISVDDGESLFMRQLDSALPWSPFEYMVSNGIPSTQFLIPSLLNTAGYYSTTDVQQLLAAGHCICPHGATSLASLANDAARRADVASNIEGLRALGVSTEDFITRVTNRLETLPRVTGGIANSIVNAGVAVKLAMAKVGEEINRTFKISEKLDAFATWVSNLAQRFSNLDDSTKRVIAGVAVFAITLGPLLKVAQGVVWIVGQMQVVFLSLQKALALSMTAQGIPGLIEWWRKLNVVMKANYLGVAVAVLVALGAALYAASKDMSAAAQAQRKVEEVSRTAADADVPSVHTMAVRVRTESSNSSPPFVSSNAIRPPPLIS